MDGAVLIASDAAVLQMVVCHSIGQQVIIILTAGLYIVIGILVKTTERVTIIDLVVETESSFKEGITNMILLLIVNHPQCICKDSLFELAMTLSSVICPKKVGEKFQTTRTIGKVDALVIGITTTTA